MQGYELYIHSWRHDGVSCSLTKREKVLDLPSFVCFYRSTLMRHIDKCIKLFFCHFCLTMEVYLPSEYPPESSHKKFYEPIQWKTDPHKHLIYRCDFQSDCISKAHSDDLRRNLTKEKNRKECANIDDGRRKMIREAKYSDHLRGDIFLSYKCWSTRNKKCSDEIRDEQFLIFLFETSKSTSSPSFLLDPSFELMLTDWHERYLRSSKKC